MNTFRIQRGYDLLAGMYDAVAKLFYGNALRKAQRCHLGSLPKAAHVLVVGGGSGWFLEQLVLIAEPASVLYLDLSPKMLELARKRISKRLPEWEQRIEFLQGNVEGLAIEGGFDVVVTHCLLDMFDGLQLRAIMGRLKKSLVPHGLWYFSDFHIVSPWPMSWISRAMIWMMYRFFRWLCDIPARRLPDFEVQFQSLSMVKELQESFYGGMIKAEIWRKP